MNMLEVLYKKDKSTNVGAAGVAQFQKGANVLRKLADDIAESCTDRPLRSKNLASSLRVCAEAFENITEDTKIDTLKGAWCFNAAIKLSDTAGLCDSIVCDLLSSHASDEAARRALKLWELREQCQDAAKNFLIGYSVRGTNNARVIQNKITLMLKEPDTDLTWFLFADACYTPTEIGKEMQKVMLASERCPTSILEKHAKKSAGKNKRAYIAKLTAASNAAMVCTETHTKLLKDKDPRIVRAAEKGFASLFGA